MLYNEIRKIPMLSITPHGITMYERYIDKRYKKECSENTDDKQRNEITDSTGEETTKTITHERFCHDGIISYHSQKKMKTALEWLILISRQKKIYSRSAGRFVKFKLCFVTLTLPSQQRHTDQQVKSKCLNSLLIELRKFHGLKNYIWRAEKQANGNIHFHLVMDKFIEASKLRERWNRICNVLGYTSEYTNRMCAEIHEFSDYKKLFGKQGSEDVLHKRYAYGKATGWTNPNSTDIHSIRKVHNILAYLFKYMSKNISDDKSMTDEEKELLKVSGQLWNLSESLSKMQSVKIVVDSYVDKEIQRIMSEITSYEYRDDFFFFKGLFIKDLIKLDCCAILKEVYGRMTDVFGIDAIGMYG